MINFNKINFKNIFAFFMRFNGLPIIIRNVYAKNKVTILVYHNPKKEIFEKHMEYLSKKYRFISIDTLINAIYSNKWSNIPPKSLIVTIDDGCKENYYLLEVFKKYKIFPYNIYLQWYNKY